MADPFLADTPGPWAAKLSLNISVYEVTKGLNLADRLSVRGDGWPVGRDTPVRTPGRASDLVWGETSSPTNLQSKDWAEDRGACAVLGPNVRVESEAFGFVRLLGPHRRDFPGQSCRWRLFSACFNPHVHAFRTASL